MKVVLTGGTGFLGRALVEALLQKAHEVVLLTRNPALPKKAPGSGLQILTWNFDSNAPWVKAVDGADAVIHLAGEAIAAKRWTTAQKKRIMDSRVEGTRAVVEAVQKAAKKPSVLVNASAIGFYGNVDEGEVTESHPPGKKGFLTETCVAWEREAEKASALGVRVIRLRIGVVLEKGGGALARMLPPFLMFAGGPLGSGRQWFPWVHREDLVGMILYCLEHPQLQGAVNATAPAPLRMSEFCKVLGKVLHRPSWAPVPGFALRVILGEMSEMLLGGQKVIPEKVQKAGYRFRYPDAEAALRAILN